MLRRINLIMHALDSSTYLCLTLAYDSASSPNLHKVYRRLLHRKNEHFLSQRRWELYDALCHSPKAFWWALFPRHHTISPTLDPNTMFFHTTSLYDIPGQSPTCIPSPPTLSHLFSKLGIRKATRALSYQQSS